MYAVLEFEKRNCAVVPLNWLTDDEKKCYWPKSVNNQIFEKMVQGCKVEPPSYPKYDIIKIIQITADYNDACNILQMTIEESSSSESGEINESLPLNILKPNTDCAEKRTEPLAEKRNHRETAQSTDEESSSEFSDCDNSFCENTVKKCTDSILLLLIIYSLILLWQDQAQ